METSTETLSEPYFKGRGAQINPNTRFQKYDYVQEHAEGLDEAFLQREKTEIIYTYPKTIINKVDSPDIGLGYSLNPYQGCEHGCIYCYARPTHEYWGYSAGLDFERKIIVKQNCIELLEKHFSSKKWKAMPIMLSGNTDCYQPVERDLEITRRILKTCLKYKHPVAVITKNALIKRDLDILAEMAQHKLVHVMVSVTGMDEKMRQILEPRTASYKSRLSVIETLSKYKIPVGVMVAPIIPGINNHEIPDVLEAAGNAGAGNAGITIVRLNGANEQIFKDWLYKNLPDRADKVWHQIAECHGGQVSDSRHGVRMHGEGKIAESIMQLFRLSKKRFIQPNNFEFNCADFNYRANDIQLALF
ncbi:MAG: PA0069 family radical SAM protein [Bacteroidetes bacterium]|nr:PA0069 family radical SAM protein [Bacteroidota bacterium]